MATFKKSYLPSQSQPWAKQLETQVDATERNLKSLDVNNRSKDEQFAASLNRLDSATRDAAVAAEAAAIAAGQAGAAAVSAQSAIDSVLDLSSPGGPSINASNISGGTITGVLFRTATSGTRLETESSAINFYGPNGLGGSITGVYQLNSNTVVNAVTIDAGNYLVLDAPNVIVNNGLAVLGGNLVANDGNISTINTISGGTISGSTISGSTISGSTVSAGQYYIGNRNITVGNTTTGSFAGNCFVNTNGEMFRSTASSSREAKNNIVSYQFDTDAFIAVNPVTFNYKPDAVQTEEETKVNQLGFILEDFEDAGVGEHLIIPANEVDIYKGLRYDKLYMMLHKVVQSQDATIKDLTARIEALEAK
jgi:hypothetical protein